MPAIIDAVADSRTPFSILTKGSVPARDLPLSRAPVGIGVSLALHEPDLQALPEPGTPTPRGRRESIWRMTGTGPPCGVLVAPLLRCLTDSTERLCRLDHQLAGVGVTGVRAVARYRRQLSDRFSSLRAEFGPGLRPSDQQGNSR